MENKSLNTLIAGCLITSLSLVSGCKTAAPLTSDSVSVPSKPNVIVVLVDDLGWRDLGVTGSTFYETPHIDALAQKSAVFTSAYSSHPVCSPTRAALMTGRKPARLGVTDWIPGEQRQEERLLGPSVRSGLALEEVTIAEHFKSSGYRTFFAGKWHLGGEGSLPEDHGFDVNIGGHHRGSPRSYVAPYRNPKLVDGPDGEYLTDRLTSETLSFIAHDSTKPFLAFLSFYNVHTPIQPAAAHIKHYAEKAARLPEITDNHQNESGHARTKQRQDNADYASMIAAVDANIGRLVRRLEELGIDDNTILVLTSDNGGLSTIESSYKVPTSNLPLRAGKGWLYEGGIRVPMIVRYPNGNIMAGRIDHPIESTDILPTVLNLAGIDGSGVHFDGQSFLPALSGNAETGNRALYWHYPHYHTSGWKPGSAMRQGKWKLIELYETGKAELYDLSTDPGETKDLSTVHQTRTAKMRDQLQYWLQSVGADMPTPNPAFRETNQKP